ncbi:MAG: cation:proton antiporter [Acidimicrobiales bacterium]
MVARTGEAGSPPVGSSWWRCRSRSPPWPCSDGGGPGWCPPRRCSSGRRSPTDPVLASDVQVGPPGDADHEDDVRFALTSEAGLNDGLAFPFTNAAIAWVASGSAGVGGWLGGWVVEDVVVRLGVGLALGYGAGRVIGWVLFRLPTTRAVAESAEGFVALAATLLVYAVTELAHGYGFLAVFVAACVLRDHERDHSYHEVLHASAESIERLASAALLVLLGGALVDGALEPLTPAGVAVAVAVVLVVRPLVGWMSLARTGLPAGERGAIAFFGIRGIGSVYYLAHALNEAPFAQARELWAIAALTIVLSVVVHGLSAAPVISRLDRSRDRPRRTGRTRRLLDACRRAPALAQAQ